MLVRAGSPLLVLQANYLLLLLSPLERLTKGTQVQAAGVFLRFKGRHGDRVAEDIHRDHVQGEIDGARRIDRWVD